MSVEKLSRKYKARLADPRTFRPTNYASDAWEYADRYRLRKKPMRIGHSVLLFGDFESSGAVDCQPWVVGPKAPPIQKVNEPRHYFAIHELDRGIKGFKLRKFTYPTPQTPDGNSVEYQAWTGYIWESPDDQESDYTLVVPDYHLSAQLALEPACIPDKVKALVRGTEPGNALERHSIHIPQAQIIDGQLRPTRTAR